VHPVALTARKLADLFLLVGAAEVEQRAIGPAGDLAAAEVDLVLAARDLLPNGLVGRQRIARLVDIAEPDSLADAETAVAPGQIAFEEMRDLYRYESLSPTTMVAATSPTVGWLSSASAATRSS